MRRFRIFSRGTTAIPICVSKPTEARAVRRYCQRIFYSPLFHETAIFARSGPQGSPINERSVLGGRVGRRVDHLLSLRIIADEDYATILPMKTPAYSKELKVAKKLALKAGKIMLQYFDVDQGVQVKNDKSLLTIADTLINEMVINELVKDFPGDGIIGEEKSNSEYGMGRKWICDPIDGTAGYVWGTPTAVFSLALVVDGDPVLGVAYDPFLKRMYEGVRGGGSYCNKKKLQVSALDLSNGILAVSGSVKSIPKLAYLPEVLKFGTRLATFSGAVYKACLVAKGKFIAYVEHGVGAHDLAAIHVIVEEAGGKVTGITGNKLDYSKPFKDGIISNGKVHDQLVKLVNEFPRGK